MLTWKVLTTLLLGVLRTGQSYTNPVIGWDNPDPAVLALPTGGYIVVTTHGTWSSDDALSIHFSSDLLTWDHQGYVFPAGSWPAWCHHNMWAPEIHFVNGRYLAYFSCAAANGRRSVGVAVSQSESYLGPYQDIGVPLVYHNEDSVVGCLDQTYFKDPVTGKDYLLWKTDKLVPLIIGVIYIQELEESGTAMRNGSSKVKVLQVDQSNEDFVVEGPWLMYKDEEYFLFYSAGNYKKPTYRLMVARSTELEGPYRKGEIPVVETDWERYDQGLNTTWEGPGHGSVVKDEAGAWWLVYHSWSYRHDQLETDPGRVMLLDRLEWHGSPLTHLWPRVGGGGVPSHSPQPDPVVG